MAFTGDDSWYDHVDEVFGSESHLIHVPRGAVWETPESRVRVTTLTEVRESDRGSRGCQMEGGPSNCPLYQIQACGGGKIACTMQEAFDRSDR